MSAPEALLFDLDGVLVDTYEVWFHLLNDVARRLDYPPVDAEAYQKTWGQGLEEDVRRFYPRHTVPQIRQEYDRYYGDHLHHLKAMPGGADVLARLPQPKAVITNSPVSLARRALALAKLEPFFREVVGSDLVANSKPAPDMVFEACRRLGTTPDRVLVIGDSRYDEGAAKAAGAPFVWFRSFAKLRI